MALVYILDDNVEFGTTLCAMCEIFGHTALSVATTDEFIAHMQKSKPDLVLLDMWLGNTTGIDLYKSHRDIFENVPIVMISGGGHEIPLEAVTAMGEISGFDDVLYKPVTASQLEELLNKLIPTK
ncbi:hypothetical protein GCM10008927_12390 [Amylibacter ulvae]|uniref:Response regulatory domain-containing protein n=1 Tax=Paramylibacter ulvae TaxID=1651968 RepID=A0ABQ3CZ17_9RHOB|nr:response regulator [Amylibacter ulvae]GHA48776.1 hypothetical protein GCM10008927_12390 [Amylibacter ulvae]